MDVPTTQRIRTIFLLREVAKAEELASRYRRFSHLALREANELDAIGRDGDAMLSRENAYLMSLEATWCYRTARELRDKLVTVELDATE